jgi:hypothetical protein
MAEEIIVLTGIKETLVALKEFDKVAVRKFNKVVRDELASAESSARNSIDLISNTKTNTPMSGWRTIDALKPTKTRNNAGWPGWNKDVIKAGIKKTRVQGKVRGDYTTSAGALINESASGAIFEVAGRKSSGTGTGVSFINTLNARFQTASRTIWRTADRDRPRIQANVNNALNEAKALLQKHLEKERA